MKSRTKHNVYSLFEEWVKENNSQLNVPLIRAPYKKGKLYYFKDIPDILSLNKACILHSRQESLIGPVAG